MRQGITSSIKASLSRCRRDNAYRITRVLRDANPSRRPSHRDVWHLDEVVVSIACRKHWLRRAVDKDGYALDKIVQSRRYTKAARRLLVRLPKPQILYWHLVR